VIIQKNYLATASNSYNLPHRKHTLQLHIRSLNYWFRHT